MTPHPKRQAVIVGLFTTFALAILAGGILTVGDLNDTFTQRISVSADFAEVNGLQEGDNIWFSGLKVGIVRELEFSDNAAVRVSMRIDERAAAHIHRDTLAKIGSDGLIGSTIVVLYGGTPESPTLSEGDVFAVGRSVSTDEIMAMLKTNGDNLLGITTDVREVTRRLAAGEGSAGKLLKDDDLYASVEASVGSLGSAAESAQGLASDLSKASARLQAKGGLVDSLASDRTTYAELTASVSGLRQATDRASELVDGIARGAEDPATPVGLLLHDPDVAADIKATVHHLNRGSLLLSEDLEAAQHSFLLRGFFVKRERARLSMMEEGAAP